ncbi:MAG TPA: HD domain-containing phosphohydrolase [Usitatibacteraceae bacterium]|nr:HD domain-containing phosphohydrolase [Usitatibacteraceae bacterium]
MNVTPGTRPESPSPDLLRRLESRLPQLDRQELAGALAPLMARLQERLSATESTAVTDAVLSLCRRLYADARSGDALPLAQGLLAQAGIAGDVVLERRASSACGLLAADTADVVGAIAYHARSLAIAAGQEDCVEQSRTWNNIGMAFGIAGNHELAARCYQRALALVQSVAGPVYSRCTASSNLANSLYQLGEVAEGLRFANLSLEQLSPAFLEQDVYGAMLLRRNLVRLLISSDRVAEAEVHVQEAALLADRVRTPRAYVASAITRAAYELATGRIDIALTRLDDALSKARSVPATLRDTLASIIRAEEAAGNAERALVRFHELADHVYRLAIARAHEHVELACLWDASATRADHLQEQARARLVSHLRPPGEPDEWKALQRLAVAAALRFDNTGWHGVRVGELTKALAIASGLPPLQALEIGLAAELHDIGLVSVPEGILSKRGPLNNVERALVERHSEAGAEILRDDRHPRILLARDIAKYHHARWDGKGRPERVGGRFIPLPARLCTVADAYDAMVCGLGREGAMTMSDALKELRREAGAQFDPELVACFEAMIRDETSDRGIDPATMAGLENFQELVLSLQEDRGYV